MNYILTLDSCSPVLSSLAGFIYSAGTLAFFLVFFLLDELFAACLAVAASLAPVGASC